MMSQVSLDKLLSQAHDIARKTRRDEPASPCVGCKSEVAILPLRYAVMTSDDEEMLMSLAPELPANLGRELLPLEAAGVRYAVRAMRSGYLYAFVKRFNRWNCESAWRVTGTGVFSPIWPYAPDLPYTPEPGRLFGGFGSWTILFKAPEDIDEARLLFTPDPLTERMLDNVRDTTSLRNKLQAFDIREIAKSCSFASDVLDPTAFDRTVAEDIAEPNTRLAAALAGQLHSDPEYSHAPQFIASDLRETSTRARGAGVVLYDSIGITQQLNAWRNEAVEKLQAYLNRGTDGKGINNERRVLVAQAFDDVRRQFEEKSAALEAQHYIDIERARVFDPETARARNWILNNEEQKRWDQTAEQYISDYETTLRARVQTKLDNGIYRDRFQNKYITPSDPQAALQVGAMKEALTKFETECQAAETEAARRAKPHERWLQSKQLLDGLAVYDDVSQANGWRFAGQTGLCIFGADGCKTTADLIQQWWQGRPGDDNNLALRSFGLNQKDIRAEMAKTLEKAKSTPLPIDAETIYQYTQTILEKTKDLADLFDKANGLYEELAAANQDLSGGVLAWYASLGRQTLRHAPRGMEWFVHGATRAWMAASIGKRAVNLRVEELQAIGRSADPKLMRAQVVRNVNFAFATELANARSSEFYKVRASGWLLLLEASLLSLKLRELPKDAKEVATLAAAVLAAGAAGIEVLATGTELVLRYYHADSTTSVGATVFLGRLRLWGGALATIGSVVLLQNDWADGTNASNEGRKVLGVAYRLRFYVGAAMTVSQASLAFAAAHPMFKILAARSAHFLGFSIHRVLAFASNLLSRQAVTLLLRRILLGGTWVTIGATIPIAIFDDDALQKWCQRTIYRGLKFSDKDNYKDTADELGRLYSALGEVI